MRNEFILITLAVALFAWAAVRHLPPWGTVAGAVVILFVWKRFVRARIERGLDLAEAEAESSRAVTPEEDRNSPGT